VCSLDSFEFSYGSPRREFNAQSSQTFLRKNTTSWPLLSPRFYGDGGWRDHGACGKLQVTKRAARAAGSLIIVGEELMGTHRDRSWQIFRSDVEFR